MDFFLFLLVNATLFIRPAELIPATYGWPIYNFVIVINLLVAAPAIINHLKTSGLTRCPTTTCVLGVLLFIAISHVARFDFWSAREGAFDFGKVVAYFLLLMATVNTPRRLFTFLGTIVALTLTINVLAVLHYHGQIELPTLSVLMENDYDELTGESRLIPRMRATGIFNDPNDLSMIIVASIILCAAGLFYKHFGMQRLLLTLPLGFLGYALTLTQSRGGLLALLAGCGAFLYARYGAMRAGLIGAAGIPVLLTGFGGRQTDIGGAISSGTGHQRAELWSDGLRLFKSSPLFGIGQHQFGEHLGLVAHNSFVHALVELGFFGGAMFLGVFAIVGWSLWKLCQVRRDLAHRGLKHLLPYMIAMLAALSVSMMSLSRNYVVPPYLIAGSAAAFETLCAHNAPLGAARLTGKVLSGLFMATVGLVASIYFYVLLIHRVR